MFTLTALQWGVLLGGGLLTGITKTGLPGLGTVVAPLMASSFPVRASVAIVLPLLIVADVVAILYFRRHVVRSHLLRLVPAALAGIAAGALLMRVIDDAQLRLLIALIVVATVAAGSVLGAPRRDGRTRHIPLWVAIVLGIVGGATSMVSNASGPILTAYLLAMRLPKNEFMGTGAWYYFILNVLKVPFHLIIGTMTGATLALNAVAATSVLAGTVVGVAIIRHLPERAFRLIAMGLAMVAATNLAVGTLLTML